MRKLKIKWYHVLIMLVAVFIFRSAIVQEFTIYDSTWQSCVISSAGGSCSITYTLSANTQAKLGSTAVISGSSSVQSGTLTSAQIAAMVGPAKAYYGDDDCYEGSGVSLPCQYNDGKWGQVGTGDRDYVYYFPAFKDGDIAFINYQVIGTVDAEYTIDATATVKRTSDNKYSYPYAEIEYYIGYYSDPTQVNKHDYMPKNAFKQEEVQVTGDTETQGFARGTCTSHPEYKTSVTDCHYSGHLIDEEIDEGFNLLRDEFVIRLEGDQYRGGTVEEDDEVELTVTSVPYTYYAKVTNVRIGIGGVDAQTGIEVNPDVAFTTSDLADEINLACDRPANAAECSYSITFTSDAPGTVYFKPTILSETISTCSGPECKTLNDKTYAVPCGTDGALNYDQKTECRTNCNSGICDTCSGPTCYYVSGSFTLQASSEYSVPCTTGGVKNFDGMTECMAEDGCVEATGLCAAMPACSSNADCKPEDVICTDGTVWNGQTYACTGGTCSLGAEEPPESCTEPLACTSNEQCVSGALVTCDNGVTWMKSYECSTTTHDCVYSGTAPANCENECDSNADCTDGCSGMCDEADGNCYYPLFEEEAIEKPCATATWKTYPTCNWDASTCGCTADSECKACFSTCQAGKCVTSEQTVTKPCSDAVWRSYPTCSWDRSNCDVVESCTEDICDGADYIPCIDGILDFNSGEYCTYGCQTGACVGKESNFLVVGTVLFILGISGYLIYLKLAGKRLSLPRLGRRR